MSFDIDTVASQAAQQYEQAYLTHETLYEEARNPYVGWTTDPVVVESGRVRAAASANEVGARWKGSARVATVDNITLSGTQRIDDVLVSENNRVLVKNQSDGTKNGIYDVKNDDWVRSSDADTAEDLLHFAIYVREGETQADFSFTCVTNPITLEETPLVIEQFANRYSNQDVNDFLYGAERAFWEGIGTLKNVVDDWARALVQALDDAAEAVTLWYEKNIAGPWGRGDNVLDSIARIVFGEVRSGGNTEGDDIPENFDYDNNATRARTLIEWITKEADDSWAIATWIWNQAKSDQSPVGPLLTWLEDTVTAAVQSSIEWANVTLYAPYDRRDTAEPLDGFLDGVQRIIFGEVKTRTVRGVSIDIKEDGKRVDARSDPDWDATSENTRGRNFFEWWEDVLSPSIDDLAATLGDWLWLGAKALPFPIGNFFRWVDTWKDEFIINSIKWTTDNITEPYDRRDTDEPLDGFLDGIQRIIFGEVKTRTVSGVRFTLHDDDGNRIDARSDPDWDATSENTRGRNFFEWWGDVLAPSVQGFFDWVWGGLTSAPDPFGKFFTWLGTVVNETLQNITEWSARYLFGPYSRRTVKDGDALDGFFDGLARIIFGEVKGGDPRTDGDSFDPDDETDGFTPTSANTRPRSFFEWWGVAVNPSVEEFLAWIKTGITSGWNLLVPMLPEWDDDTKQWWDDAFEATWEALDNGAKAGFTAIKNLFFGNLIPQAYAEGAADNQITAGLKEETEEDGVVDKAGVIEARIRRDNAETINMMLPDDQKVTIPSEDSDDGILGALAEAAANFVAWISGGGGDEPTDGLANLQQLTQKITWKLATGVVPDTGEIGMGSSSTNELYFNVPTDKFFRFRINSKDRLTITKDHLGTWGKILPEGTTGTLTLGDNDNRWHAVHTEALRLGGTAPDTKVNGMIWMDSSGNVKIRSNSDNVTIAPPAPPATPTITGLTSPITWSTATSGKTGGTDNENNIGFDNSNDFYIRMKGTKIIIKSGTTDIFEVKLHTEDDDGRIKVRENMTPFVSKDASLGVSTNRWNEVHTHSIIVYDGVAALYPGADNTHPDIGLSVRRFGTGYFDDMDATVTETKTIDLKQILNAAKESVDPTTITNGMIWRKGTQVFIQTNNTKVDVSDISFTDRTSPISWSRATSGKTGITGDANNTVSGIAVRNSNLMDYRVKDNTLAHVFGGGHSGFFEMWLGRFSIQGVSNDTFTSAGVAKNWPVGTFWKDTSGRVKVRTLDKAAADGKAATYKTVDLSNISGSGIPGLTYNSALVGGAGIEVSVVQIVPDDSYSPNLGKFSEPFGEIYGTALTTMSVLDFGKSTDQDTLTLGDGIMWRNGSDVYIKSGGVVTNFTNIGGGGGAGAVTNVIKVVEFSDPEHIDRVNLDNAFGEEQGCVGITIKNGALATGVLARVFEPGQVNLWIRGRFDWRNFQLPRAENSEGSRFERVDSTSSTGQYGVEHKKFPVVTTLDKFGNRIEGGVASLQPSNSLAITLITVTTEHNYSARSLPNQSSNTSKRASTAEVEPTMTHIPTIIHAAPIPAMLDIAFGTTNGSIGLNIINGARADVDDHVGTLFIRVNGFWFSRDMENNTAFST